MADGYCPLDNAAGRVPAAVAIDAGERAAWYNSGMPGSSRELPSSNAIVGVDLSSDPKKTAAVWFERDHDDGVSRGYIPGSIENEQLGPCLHGDKVVVGIDAPFGWPRPFIRGISWWEMHASSAHDETAVWLTSFADNEKWTDAMELLCFRMTDRFVRLYMKNVQGDPAGWPKGLSVSTNWISYTTVRLAGLLTPCEGIKRDGRSGPALEVYPAASLAAWSKVGSYKPKKKQPDKESAAKKKLEDLADWIIEEISCTQPDITIPEEFEGALRSSDDLLDAAVAALTTWAALVGCTYLPSINHRVNACKHRTWAGSLETFWNSEQQLRSVLADPVDLQELVDAEGWIHHPTCEPESFLRESPWNALEQR